MVSIAASTGKPGKGAWVQPTQPAVDRLVAPIGVRAEEISHPSREAAADRAELQQQQRSKDADPNAEPAPVWRSRRQGGEKPAYRVELDGACDPEHRSWRYTAIGDDQQEQDEEVRLAEIERADHGRKKAGDHATGQRQRPAQLWQRSQQDGDRESQGDQAEGRENRRGGVGRQEGQRTHEVGEEEWVRVAATGLDLQARGLLHRG